MEAPEEPLMVRADDEAVRQILENLIGNAIKYTPPDGRVTVRWRRQHNRALIEVSDTGIGIEAAHLDRLFERFYRVDKARSRELGGTGLGLSIVKHLAQFFGGSVGVRSVVGQGSTFWVTLPLSE
jgi:two-component system phosphate regulon sensor histidine kinase PhoR